MTTINTGNENKKAILCSQKSEYTNKRMPLHIKYIGDCEHKAAYKVSYKRGTDGRMEENVLMCKKHFNAFMKNHERIKKQTNWDAKLTYIKL